MNHTTAAIPPTITSSSRTKTNKPITKPPAIIFPHLPLFASCNCFLRRYLPCQATHCLDDHMLAGPQGSRRNSLPALDTMVPLGYVILYAVCSRPVADHGSLTTGRRFALYLHGLAGYD
jgi:hypothetical protein